MAQDPAFPNAGGVSFGEDPLFRLIDDLISAGVVAIASDYQVIQNHLGANMSVDVQPGNAYVAVTNGGKRRTRLGAQSNSGLPGSPNAADNWLTTFTASDATNPRIDRVVLTVRDASVDGSGAYNSALRVIAGTPTAGATLSNLNGAASVPANSLLLANVLVPNSATTITTANIGDVRTAAKLGGNIVGSGLLARATALTIATTTTETDVLNVSVPGGLMGPNGKLKFILQGDHSGPGGGAGWTFRVYLGAQKLWDSGLLGFASGTNSLVRWEGEIVNLGSSGSQTISGLYSAGNATSGQYGGAAQDFSPGSVAPGTVDTTTAQTLRLTIQPSATTITFRRYWSEARSE